MPPFCCATPGGRSLGPGLGCYLRWRHPADQR